MRERTGENNSWWWGPFGREERERLMLDRRDLASWALMDGWMNDLSVVFFWGPP